MALRKSRDAEACWAMHLNTSYRSLLPSFWQTHTQLHCKFVSPVGGLPIDCPLPASRVPRTVPSYYDRWVQNVGPFSSTVCTPRARSPASLAGL